MKTILMLVFLLCSAHLTQAADTHTQNTLGGMEPIQALTYMKTTDNLLIVDVATKRHFASKHFMGAVSIPIENISSKEAKDMYMSLPAGRPVLLHCRLGMIVPGAYETLKNLRPDIPEIAYITGRPLFDEYNNWHETVSPSAQK